MAAAQDDPKHTAFLSGGGEMAAAVRAHDWSATPLGPIEGWPQALKAVVGLVIGSPLPMIVLWGPELVQIYNDGCRVVMGAKHPSGLGRPTRECWPEVWEFSAPVYDAVRRGEARAFEGRRLIIERLGRPENAWFDLTYGPLRDEAGAVAGVLVTVIETTERVRSEAALRAERDRAQGVLDNMEEAFVLLDRDFRIVDMNAEAMRLESRPREAILGKTHWETHPNAAPELGALYREAMAERKAVALEHNYVWPDGRDTWIDMRAYPVDGGLAIFYRDATERQAQEAALREETHTLETLNRTGATLAGELDLEQLLQTVTDAAVELTGARFGAYFHNVMDETGERLHLFTLSGAERAAFLAMGRPRATAIFGPTFRNETVIRSDDILADPRYGLNAPHKGMPEGHLPVRSYLAIPVAARTGEVLGGLIFGHPDTGRFTERHERLMTGLAAQAAVAIDNARLFQEVQAANETLEARVAERTAERDEIWRTSRDLMLVALYDATILAVNPAWTEVLGWREAELVGKSFLDFIHPDDMSASLAEAGRLSAEGRRTMQFENRYRRKDGGWAWLSWAVSSQGGRFYAVARDVTEDKARRAELEQAQEALRQSQKMEAVGQLTGGLAHDFNNLLAGISGSLDLMQTRIAQGRIADVERYVLAAQGAAKRAAALTHRLLAFSRRQTLEPKATDVNRLVAGMEELIRRTVGPTVEVEAVAQAGLWPTLVDANQLENALLNLCINARDAMPGGGKLTIETANRWLDERAARERDLPPGQYVSLCVSDNGVGMAPEVVAKAFDPFFTTKPIGQGTGLGLSMIYGFARQSGGQARIYSEVGQGTMVCLYLPRHHAEEEVDAPEPVKEAGRADAGETVLVIDDEPLVRMVVVDVLEELGLVAIEADDGPEGLKVIRSDARVDLLITDVGLPNGMNGRQVAEAARALRPGLKVLFVTGYAENAILSHGHLDPGMQVVTKPFDMQRLTSRIREMVSG